MMISLVLCFLLGCSTRVVGVALGLGLSKQSIVVDEWLIFFGLVVLNDLGKLEGEEWSEEEDKWEDDGSNRS